MSKPKIQRGAFAVTYCTRCGQEIYEGEAHHTHMGDLCDICYGDLYY